jgi:anti-anti-sigma regulatory factor
MSDFTIRVSEGLPQGLAIVGELDIATSAQVDAAIASISGDVDVDCGDLSFIDSAGFYSFDHGYEAAMTRGSTFKLSGLKPFATWIAEFLAVPYFSRAVPRLGE